MASFSDIGVLLGDISLLEIEHFTKNPMKAQKSTLKKILGRNKNSEIGKKYGFKNINSIEEYQANVPLSFYEDYVPYVERMIHNKEKNLMFTGPNIRYCSSSGSVGKPKILPKSIKDLWNMQCIGFSCTVATASHYLKKVKGKKMPAQMGPLVLILTGHPLEDGKMC
ncbi:MAG: GH3 auxin-responsive promoter family protein, partial [Acutalibacteraceae bacterium]|nr:GH3 auxin-responsive promoter family protein [Acutalibacteraceae bacterium]